jgi:Peptidase S24-like
MPDPALRAARLALFERYREQRAVEWIGATGTSMLPAIGEGDRLLVDFGETRMRLGDIVLFPGGGQLLSHRVVLRGADGALVTKGDNRQHFDPPVQREEILGVIRAVGRGDDGVAVSSACVGSRAVALALVSAAGGSLLGHAGRVPQSIRHPLGRLARAISTATIRLLAPR